MQTLLNLFSDYNWIFNYYSIGALIPFSFLIILAFFLLNLRQKSQATFHMGIAFFFMSLQVMPYFFASTVYDSIGAYHRWFTVGFVFPAILHFTQFLFHFPDNPHPRIARYFLYGQHALAIALTFIFMAQTASAERVYHFDGNYWDFNAEDISRLVAIFIIIYILILVGVGLYKFRTTRNDDRWSVLTFVIAIMIASVVPAVLNVFSRDGAIDRGTFQTWFDLLIVLGFFIVIIVYINTTNDKTPFLFKIIGVSLVTLLLVLQGISYFAVSEQDRAYDQYHQAQAQLALSTHHRPSDLEYITSFHLTRRVVGHNQTSRAQIAWRDLLPEYFATALLEVLEDLPAKDFAANALLEIKKFHKDAPASAAGFHAFLEDLLRRQPDIAPAELIEEVVALRRALVYRQNKLRAIPVAKFQDKAPAEIAKFPSEIAIFGRALQDFWIKRDDMKPEQFKKQVLDFLAPLAPAGTRRYRTETTGQNARHFVSYVTYNEAENTIYEVGFPYRAYRLAVHPFSLKLFMMIIFLIGLIMIGFRFFFRGALLNPLEALLHGVRTVNDGSFNVQVPVKVEDEIGFITRSFNSMVLSIREANHKLHDYAENLEAKVKERTAELRLTLEEVQTLKKQQDGDYFLTAILIKPLGANHVRSNNVTVDFLVKQKKQFEFRRWTEEIGGDICIAHTIHLQDKPYTLFLNADAMGKSIQGAGGALVLGAVFEALLERTKLSGSIKMKYPERWLKDAFVELQKVFESFDGSMLVSVFLGLIEDETGLMYFLNAEHPWTALYRDDRAEFIEKEMLFRKLGTQGMEGGVLYVQTFQLEPGDVIIAGSDGRDDVLLSTDENGVRVINEDETLFLRAIEKAGGSLQKIKDEIVARGELTDDFSLVRVGYQENRARRTPEELHQKIRDLLAQAQRLLEKSDFEAAWQLTLDADRLEAHRHDVLRMQVKIQLKKRNFPETARLAEDYTILRPSDSEFFYIASYCHKMAGNTDRAIDLGERYRLRNPTMVKNLVNLADAYKIKKQFERARTLLAQALKVDPQNPKALAISEALEKRMASQNT